jgi:hypothetical protein
MSKKTMKTHPARKVPTALLMKSVIDGKVFGITRPGKVVLLLTTGTLIDED